MKEVKAFIIEKDEKNRNILCQELNKFSNIQIVGTSENLEEVVHKINNMDLDILFVEINGETQLGAYNNLKFRGKIVFRSTFSEFNFQAFGMNSFDYTGQDSKRWLKNILESIFDDNKIYHDENFSKKFQYNDRIIAAKRDSVFFLKISSISFIRSSRDYTEIYYYDGNKYLFSKTMKEWMNRLPGDMFGRIHRSFIINFDFVQKLIKSAPETGLLYLKNYGEPIKVSRFYYKKLKKRYS